ncbi:2Fe-2S iron-sulfur cluster-binding protein [Herbaspirillum lusitanum]|uniref:2Fe-2S iron-sulfur cluster-binding protein n=1 Tax=Herbaspirillum lusitanum TaxID=213312 RepID=A0ABW9AF62_9BURK
MNSTPPPLSYSILLQPSGLSFSMNKKQSILQAALLNQIRLPSSCRNGTCRTCMCKLVGGSVSYQIEWPGVTREEQLEGWILPCVAVAESDLVLEAADAVHLK